MNFKLLKGILLTFFGLIALTASAQLNGVYELTGCIRGQNGEPLPGVTVKVKETGQATSSDKDGAFRLKSNASFPMIVTFSAVGFSKREITISGQGSSLRIHLQNEALQMSEMVVTASRKEERLFSSPVAIEKLSLSALKNAAAPGFYDALEHVKGMQMTTTSLTLKVPNTRGFNSPNNFRFAQLVDGIDMQSATLGVPLGNAVGPTELDIASIEVTPGAAAALYGSSGINGLSNLLTKNAFTTPGVSLYQRTGINHVNDMLSASVITEQAIRFAQKVNDKFAFKLNASVLKGTDWQSTSTNDQNPSYLKTANPAYPELSGRYNTAYDGWNTYGDDALAGSNTVSIKGIVVDGVKRPNLTVSRTGYREVELIIPKVSNVKFDGTIYYRPTLATELSYSFRYGRVDGVFQRGNKISLRGAHVTNQKLEFKGKNFFVRTYISNENTGNSFNVKPLADNLDLNHLSNSAWQSKFSDGLQQYATEHTGLTTENLAEATLYARSAADNGRAEPGTPEFTALRDQIIKVNNWDIKSALIPDAPTTGGAALLQKSNLYHVEGQLDLTNKVKVFDLLVGGDLRINQLVPDGNNFVDFSRPVTDRSTALPNGKYGKDQYYKKFGLFAQIKKPIGEKLAVTGSLRWDYNPYYAPTFTPRLAAVYKLADQQSLRVTFQNGYRFPSLFEALSYVNNGRVKRVGSLPFINEGLGYLGNSYTQASVANFNDAVRSAPGPASGTDATALANRNLLTVAGLDRARAEQLMSLDAGYKAVILNQKLFIDIDGFCNKYNGFLGQLQVFVPNGVTVGTDEAVLAMLDINRDPTQATENNAASLGQSRYRVYTNSKETYINVGASAGVSFNFYKRYTLSANTSFNKLTSKPLKDAFVTGFNTPTWITNLSFGNPELTPLMGFNLVYKWQRRYFWESALVNGSIAAISTFDIQTTLKLPTFHAVVKIGASDLFNKKHEQYAGGPTLGGLYYVSLSVDGLLAGKLGGK